MAYLQNTALRYEKDVPVIGLGEDLVKTVAEYTRQLIEEGKKQAVLNFEGVDYISSTCIAQLIDTYHQLHEVNEKTDKAFLGICNLSNRHRSLLDIVGMLDFKGISVSSSLDEAVEEFSQQQ